MRNCERPRATNGLGGIVSTALSTQPQYDFQRCEQVIERGLKSFIEVGTQ